VYALSKSWSLLPSLLIMVALSISVSALAVALPFFIASTTAQSSGTFDFLTYNVAGLPAFLSGNGVPGEKGPNANSIGTQLTAGDYDIVHMQEVRRHGTSPY
jgi:hypothetical protein